MLQKSCFMVLGMVTSLISSWVSIEKGRRALLRYFLKEEAAAITLSRMGGTARRRPA